MLDGNVNSKILKSKIVETNLNQGSYRSRFFELEEYQVSRVELDSVLYSTGNVESILLKRNYSFAYLRADKLKTIKTYDIKGQMIGFDKFLEKFGIQIETSNLFKCSKYLSRVFRPTSIGCWYKNLDIFINEDPAYKGKVTDGISLISIKFAESLGWKSVKPGDSAQFTLFFNRGLTKGHCVVSDKISHDVIVYGIQNIKEELRLTGDKFYVSIEPLKLGKTLRLDIQSLINLWQVFGTDQYLNWAYEGIEQFKKDLMEGKLINWLDDFDSLAVTDYEGESWALRKAIWHKIDYRQYPGLFRASWLMFKKSMIRFAEDSNDKPVFRIPIPGGIRAYLRPDLRRHDSEGNFAMDGDSLTVDAQGNLWVPLQYIDNVVTTAGNCDFDDSFCIVPTSDSQAILWRNPNQYGECLLMPVRFEGVDIKSKAEIIAPLPVKKPGKKFCGSAKSEVTHNALLDRFLTKKTSQPFNEFVSKDIPYTVQNIIKAYIAVSQSKTSIGGAANAEMFKSAIRIISTEQFESISEMFNWDLEKIIDSSVKDGIEAKEDMKMVQDLISFIHREKIPMPACLINRFPESLQHEITIADGHPLDQLLEAIKYLIKESDKEVMGTGSVLRGNRISGMIDNINTPFIELGEAAISSPLYDMALNLMRSYNRSIAILLEKTRDLPLAEAEIKREVGLGYIQKHLLNEMAYFCQDERSMITRILAYEIYKSSRAIHDSILWISDKDGLNGTASDTILMLANSGVAHQVVFERNLQRMLNTRSEITALEHIRLWNTFEIKAELFAGSREVLIRDGKGHLGNVILNLGDECQAADGVYQIKKIVQSISRKNNCVFLKNSISVYINSEAPLRNSY